jgi:hypothetical protein
MEQIKKHSVAGLPKSLKVIVFTIVALLLLVLTAVIAYEFGERRTAELILHSAYSPKSQPAPVTTGDNEKLLRDQLNRLTNDYDSACYRYQELYAAYDLLYAQAGASSGQEKVVRPDGARGNEVSCYR